MKILIAALLLVILSACAPAAPPDLDPVPSVDTSPPALASYWHPSPGDSFQLQFSGDLDLSVQADVYDLDLFDTDPASVEAIHARGNHAVCYISVGSWEDWRPDADQFPAEVIGKDYQGWPGEKWLDIRKIDKLAPILRARLDLCALKGFDGVEPDNVEIYDNDSGFPITYADQLTFAIWLANEAHVRGLAIGLKNAPDMAADALPYFDFSVLEDCYVYTWCADLRPFLEAGKPVFAIEYTDMGVDFETACAEAESLGLSMLLKHRNLDAYREACP
ncbi:MAG: endo alpha-1,4 polygalactosaminidase [Anaerolineales bacterium]